MKKRDKSKPKTQWGYYVIFGVLASISVLIHAYIERATRPLPATMMEAEIPIFNSANIINPAVPAGG